MVPFERSRSVYHRSQDQLGGIDDIRGCAATGQCALAGLSAVR